MKMEKMLLLIIHSQDNDIKAIILEGCQCLSISPFMTIQQSDERVGVTWTKRHKYKTWKKREKDS